MNQSLTNSNYLCGNSWRITHLYAVCAFVFISKGWMMCLSNWLRFYGLKAGEYNTCKKKATFIWQTASFDGLKEPKKRNTPWEILLTQVLAQNYTKGNVKDGMFLSLKYFSFQCRIIEQRGKTAIKYWHFISRNTQLISPAHFSDKKDLLYSP